MAKAYDVTAINYNAPINLVDLAKQISKASAMLWNEQFGRAKTSRPLNLYYSLTHSQHDVTASFFLNNLFQKHRFLINVSTMLAPSFFIPVP